MKDAYRYAGFWLRFVADVVDSLILTGATSVSSWVFFGLLGMAGLAVDPEGVWIQLFEVIFYFGLCIPYFVLWQFRTGQTPGKKLFGMRIYSHATLGRITLRQAWLRFFGYGLSYLTLAGGYLLAAIHPEKRALHDLIAGTVVLRRRKDSGNGEI